MGRIVIPRPRTSGGRGYTPLYRPAIKARGNKFDPHRDLGLLVKALDTAVAIGGKISGAVGRAQDGPDAERARALVADDKAAAARAQAASAEMGDAGMSPAAAAFTGAQVVDTAPSPEGVEITSTPDRGSSIVPGGMPATPSPEDARQATAEADYGEGYAIGTEIGRAMTAGRGQTMQQTMANRQAAAGGGLGAMTLNEAWDTMRTQDPAWSSGTRAPSISDVRAWASERGMPIMEGSGGFVGTSHPRQDPELLRRLAQDAKRAGMALARQGMYADAEAELQRSLGLFQDPDTVYNLAVVAESSGRPDVARKRYADAARLSVEADAPFDRFDESVAKAGSVDLYPGIESEAGPIMRAAGISQPALTSTVGGPPPAVAPPAPTGAQVITPAPTAGRSEQVRMVNEQAVQGNIAPAAEDALVTAEAVTKANDLWLTAAELQRLDLGTLQALGAFADTPQKRAMLMDAIRKNPDVQPTSVSDLLGMGKDHVARAQAPALAAMKGAKPKSTADLAKKIYQMRLDEHRARIRQAEEARRADIHPHEIERRRLANEAAVRKREFETRTAGVREAKLEADLRNLRALADKRERENARAAKRAKTSKRGGAAYKKRVGDRIKHNDQTTAWIRAEGFKAEGKPVPDDIAQAMGDYAGLSKADILRKEETIAGGRGNLMDLKRVVDAIPKPAKPPTTSSGRAMGEAKDALAKYLTAATVYMPSGHPVIGDKALIEAAAMDGASAGTVDAAIDALEREEKRMLEAEAATTDITPVRNARAALAKKRRLMPEAGEGFDPSSMSDAELKALAK